MLDSLLVQPISYFMVCVRSLSAWIPNESFHIPNKEFNSAIVGFSKRFRYRIGLDIRGGDQKSVAEVVVTLRLRRVGSSKNCLNGNAMDSISGDN